MAGQKPIVGLFLTPTMKCPVCNSIFAASLRELAGEMGRSTSQSKAAAARRNGKKGGRPRKKQ